MRNDVYLGFDFGFKRIGLAVGQRLTCSASPLATLSAKQGIPNWLEIQQVIAQWKPCGLVVGIPTRIDDSEFYTTAAAQEFVQQLEKRFLLPVYCVDERFSTVEARGQLFAQGGYRKIKNTEVDSVAACIILEQWLSYP